MIDPVFRNVRFLPGTINAGFPSPASNYEERELDIKSGHSYFASFSIMIVLVCLALVGVVLLRKQ